MAARSTGGIEPAAQALIEARTRVMAMEIHVVVPLIEAVRYGLMVGVAD
jgi:hypothetical protein